MYRQSNCVDVSNTCPRDTQYLSICCVPCVEYPTHLTPAISDDIGMDADGNVYDKTAGDYPSQVIVYDSDTSKTKIRGTTDNDGYAIDIVGNRK